MGSKEYAKDGIVIVWKPDLCWHCGECAEGLPDVFRPDERPWVKLGDTPMEKVIEQVERCPSKALSWKPGSLP